MNNTVITALSNTPADHMEKTLRSRNPGPEAFGSRWESPQNMETLKAADWEEYSPPGLLPQCEAYKAALPGRLGIIDLNTLPGDTPLEVVVDGHDDRWKQAKFAAPPGFELPRVGHTTLIIGPDEDGSNGGKDLVWTTFPGDPVRPDHSSELIGKTTVAEALAQGFLWAKVVLAP